MQDGQEKTDGRVITDDRVAVSCWRVHLIASGERMYDRARACVRRAKIGLAIGLAILLVCYGLGLWIVADLIVIREVAQTVTGVVLCSVISVGMTLVGAAAVVHSRTLALEQYHEAGGLCDRAMWMLEQEREFSQWLAGRGLDARVEADREQASKLIAELWLLGQAKREDQGARS